MEITIIILILIIILLGWSYYVKTKENKDLINEVREIMTQENKDIDEMLGEAQQVCRESKADIRMELYTILEYLKYSVL